MTIDWPALRRAAEAAAANAHAPYSRFHVGAALLANDGRVFSGCNVENASFGLTICAERNAVFAAVAAGARGFRALAISSSGDQPVTPCGACRQVLVEFARSLPIHSSTAGSSELQHELATLLPHAFTSFG